MWNMGRVLHKVYRAVVNELSEELSILEKFESELSYFIPEPRNFA